MTPTSRAGIIQAAMIALALSLVTAVTTVLTGPPAAAASPPQTVRVSVTSGGDQRFKESNSPTISRTGRYVAFVSNSRLVPVDTTGKPDIYVRDRSLHKTILASVAIGGGPGDFGSRHPALSADGRYVAFESSADNLVPADDNLQEDIFVRDLVAGTTELVSVTQDGGQTVVGPSFQPSISGDGRYVAFASWAPNLVSDDFNSETDSFVRDRTLGTTERVSVATDGTEADGFSQDTPSISADGRYVVFSSEADSLVAGDTNDAADVFLHDRSSGITSRVSVGPGGDQADGFSLYGVISGNGAVVTFVSNATNLVPGHTNGQTDVFARDLVTGTTEVASVGPGGVESNEVSTHPAISGSGRYVVFWSGASNLVTGDTNLWYDVFVRDRVAGTTFRVSVGPGGAQANSGSGNYGPAISANGQHVAFDSIATNLVAGDTNKVDDIFVRVNFAG